PPAPVRLPALDRFADVRGPGAEGDVAAVSLAQLGLEHLRLLAGDRLDRAAPADLRVELADVRSALARYPAGKLAAQPAAQRQPDEERVAEEVHQERLDRLQRVRAAQIEQEH